MGDNSDSADHVASANESPGVRLYSFTKKGLIIMNKIKETQEEKRIHIEALETLLGEKKREMAKARRPEEIIRSIRAYNDCVGDYTKYIRGYHDI